MNSPIALSPSHKPSSLATTELFIAPPGCAPNFRAAYEKAVNAHPPAWRRELVSGEVFTDLAEVERRIRCRALVVGYDIVRV